MAAEGQPRTRPPRHPGRLGPDAGDSQPRTPREAPRPEKGAALAAAGLRPSRPPPTPTRDPRLCRGHSLTGAAMRLRFRFRVTPRSTSPSRPPTVPSCPAVSGSNALTSRAPPTPGTLRVLLRTRGPPGPGACALPSAFPWSLLGASPSPRQAPESGAGRMDGVGGQVCQGGP